MWFFVGVMTVGVAVSFMTRWRRAWRSRRSWWATRRLCTASGRGRRWRRECSFLQVLQIKRSEGVNWISAPTSKWRTLTWSAPVMSENPALFTRTPSSALLSRLAAELWESATGRRERMMRPAICKMKYEWIFRSIREHSGQMARKWVLYVASRGKFSSIKPKNSSITARSLCLSRLRLGWQLFRLSHTSDEINCLEARRENVKSPRKWMICLLFPPGNWQHDGKTTKGATQKRKVLS